MQAEPPGMMLQGGMPGGRGAMWSTTRGGDAARSGCCIHFWERPLLQGSRHGVFMVYVCVVGGCASCCQAHGHGQQHDRVRMQGRLRDDE